MPIKDVKRSIASPTFAKTWSADGVAWTKLVCCWDDASLPSECIRENCPYRHPRDMLAQQPGATHDWFALIPCTFAGMGDGCKWHRHRLNARKWFVPKFELQDEPCTQPPHQGEEGMELVPVYNGQRWHLQPIAAPQRAVAAETDSLLEDIRLSTKRFLEGIDSE